MTCSTMLNAFLFSAKAIKSIFASIHIQISIFGTYDEQRWARYSKRVSYYKILLLAEISILLQDTASHNKKYLITRY